MPRYLLSVHGPLEQEDFNGYPSEEEMLQSFADTGVFNDRLQQEGKFVFADGLESASTATTVDSRGEQPLVTDGPYVEAKEYLAGFWVIEAADLDEALDLAAAGSKACRRVVEVRPFQGPAGLPGS